jgi:hypothetical protein
MSVHLKNINGNYILESDYTINCIEVDGKRYKNFKSGRLEKKPISIKEIKKRSRPVRYGELTPAGYDKQIKALLAKSDHNEGEYWDNIDDEYAYKKFREDHPSEYEEYEEENIVEVIEYQIAGKTDNPYIIPYRLLGDHSHKECELYRYEPHPYKMAQAIAIELGLEEVEARVWSDNTPGMKWSAKPGSKTLEFMKMNNSYISNGGHRFNGIMAGTYDECAKRYNDHIDWIRDTFSKAIKKYKAEGKMFNRPNMVKKLEYLKRLSLDMDTKKSSRVSQYKMSQEIEAALKALLDEK